MPDPDPIALPQSTNQTVDSGKTLSTLKNLWPYMWPSGRPDLKARVVWATFYLVLAKFLTVGIPYFYKWATDALTGADSAAKVLPLILTGAITLVVAYNVARIVSVALNQLRDALFANVGQHAVRRLAFHTFNHLHRLSLRFHLERRTGGLSRVIERGTKGIETIVRFAILNTLPTILEFVLTAVIFGFAYGLSYVLVVSLTVALYSWFTIWASDWRIKIRKEMNDSDTEANTKAIDSLLNFETVKYFGNEAMEAERFDRAMARYEKAATDTWVSLGWLNFGQGVIFSVGMAVVMVMSAMEVRAGTQTLGDFVFVNSLLMQLSIPLNFIGFIYRELRQGLTDIEEMFLLLDVPQEVRDREDASTLSVTQGWIRFDNVRFRYESGREILKGISFEVPAGKTVAIVGPSGAGKSTISRLLYRFYDIESGRITVDGQDIAGVTQSSLRAAIGIVPQDTVLFNDTLEYNIRYGRVEASDEEVRLAATRAQIGSFIELLPDGYRTMVGERGLKLSGGEKQRVAIARTLLKGPPILLLDEATSALDTHTEQDIQSALEEAARERTTLTIAHRLSTIVGADEILVLKAGEIVERGTHATLLEAGGLYAEMWRMQREATEAEEALRRARAADEFGIVDRQRLD